MASPPNNIRALRIHKGLTLEQLAALTPHPKPERTTDLSTIQKLELGKRKLTTEWMTSIAEALEVDPRDLLGVAQNAVPSRKVPLVGKIAQGNWREAIEDPLALIPTTKGGPNTFIDPDDREMVDKKYYAMLRAGGETTFKQFRTDPLRLEPCSNNKDHKTMLIGEEALTTIGRVVGQESDL
jgi:repressor LexA